MKILDKLERKFGKYAIYNLPSIIVGLYVIGFFIEMAGYGDYLTLNPMLISQGEIWRLFSFILIPPTTSIFWMILGALFYHNICQSLVNVWGAFRFNLYYFSGIILILLSTVILFWAMPYIPINVDTTYLNLSLFLAYAAVFPDELLYIYLFFPVKAKWLGYLDALYLGVALVRAYTLSERISILVAILNFIIFFIMSRNVKRFSPKEVKRRSTYRAKVKEAETLTRHQCTTCGRTEQDDPTLEFRFCSKCDGNHEYCQDHLFTHTHVKR